MRAMAQAKFPDQQYELLHCPSTHTDSPAVFAKHSISYCICLLSSHTSGNRHYGQRMPNVFRVCYLSLCFYQ